MRIFGWEDVDDVKGFTKYIVENKLLSMCRTYLSRTTISALENLTPEDLYLLTFVYFIEIKGPRRYLERFSFKVYDLYPGDYGVSGSQIIPVEIRRRNIRNIILRRINAYRNNNSNESSFGDWIVEIIGDKSKSKGKRRTRARRSPKIDSPLKKYIGYYLCPHLSEETPEGRIIRRLYREMGVFKY